jgi:hypothetical protein
MADGVPSSTLKRMRTFGWNRRSGARPAALVALVLSGSVALAVISASPASAADGGPVSPVAECVSINGNGSFTAVFGTDNPSNVSRTLVVGPDNFFSPVPKDRGQPTVFPAKRSVAAFSVTFDGKPMTWTLNGKTVTVSSSSPSCGAGPNVAEAPYTIGLIALMLALAAVWIHRSRRGMADRAPASVTPF